MIKVWKAIIDTVGHYARPDIVRLQYLPPADAQSAVVEAFEKAPAAKIEEIAEQHETSRQSVEAAVERLAKPIAKSRRASR
jgi:hypothetical protein